MSRVELFVEEAPAIQLLSFELAGEEYAVDILKVQEIRSWEGATFVPNSPDYLLGLMNLRGLITPVIDLRLRFGLPALQYGATTVVIVFATRIEHRYRTVGVAVDAVSETYTIDPTELRPPPEVHSEVEFVKHLVRIEERALLVLDVEALLNSGALAPSPEALG